MKVRYKTGKFDYPIKAVRGDTLNLTVTDPNGTKQKVTEEIKISMAITHWVMFYIPNVGFGGLFGTRVINSKMDEIFVKPECINADEDLII